MPVISPTVMLSRFGLPAKLKAMAQSSSVPRRWPRAPRHHSAHRDDPDAFAEFAD